MITYYRYYYIKQLGLVINLQTIQRNQTPPPPHPAQGHPAVGKVKGQINWYIRIVIMSGLL